MKLYAHAKKHGISDGAVLEVVDRRISGIQQEALEPRDEYPKLKHISNNNTRAHYGVQKTMNQNI